MNRHLTSRQISEWASGERSPEARQHVEDCPECRAGVTRLAEVLAGFRGSVHQWSERRMSGEFSLARERRRFPLRTWCLAGVAVAVMVVLAL
ncbi:MAG: hypothetical protein NTY38_05415, partial [Acidobacteria bacterium]|nr:hypothetical protein [Acidobacteriota bacterium]